MNERTHLLYEIQKLSFVLQEVVLYLDAHPSDRDALVFYHKYNDLKTEAVKAYEEKYGPLTVSGNCSDVVWKWSQTPWPWEEE